MRTIKVKLKSDFLDYYDHWFDNDGIIFERLTNSGLKRRDMFKFLENNGYITPLNGIVKELDHFKCIAIQDMKRMKVVVYLDETKHQGEGKRLMNYTEALNEYPHHYMSLYVTNRDKATSYRTLVAGDYVFKLKYSSNDSWRSNVGNVNIELLEYHQQENQLKIPLYAIDFVRGYDVAIEETFDFAVDFNIAPMIRGTGIEDIVSAREIANSIKKYV